jgi:hypothetical protein
MSNLPAIGTAAPDFRRQVTRACGTLIEEAFYSPGPRPTP